MAQSIFVFDFGTDEEAAQQARHKIDSWKQGFRLGNKMLVKFEREESSEKGDLELDSPAKQASAGKKPAGKKSTEKDKDDHKQKGERSGRVCLLVRLDFSDHEKLSHQRWLDRVPAEEPFKSAKGETVRTGDPEFPKIADRFESLD